MLIGKSGTAYVSDCLFDRNRYCLLVLPFIPYSTSCFTFRYMGNFTSTSVSVINFMFLTIQWYTNLWSVWMRACSRKRAAAVNVLGQALHAKGRSPVCVRRWSSRSTCTGVPRTSHTLSGGKNVGNHEGTRSYKDNQLFNFALYGQIERISCWSQPIIRITTKKQESCNFYS